MGGTGSFSNEALKIYLFFHFLEDFSERFVCCIFSVAITMLAACDYKIRSHDNHKRSQEVMLQSQEAHDNHKMSHDNHKRSHDKRSHDNHKRSHDNHKRSYDNHKSSHDDGRTLRMRLAMCFTWSYWSANLEAVAGEVWNMWEGRKGRSLPADC